VNESVLGSEVARLREQIRLEHEAAQRGLYGIAQGTAQHVFITQRMENIAAYHKVLTQLTGEHEAIKILAEVFERSEAKDLLS
jgi:hypothetical protein